MGLGRDIRNLLVVQIALLSASILQQEGLISFPPKIVQSQAKYVYEMYGVQIRFHDLRHSAATILLSMGVNIKVIQEMLGHSDISITLRVYGHLLPSMQQEVVDKWEGVFREVEEEDKGNVADS